MRRTGGTAVIFVGWLYGTTEDIPRMRAFGFTGKMIPREPNGIAILDNGPPCVEYVSATKEVMERAIKEWPGFNWRSFTALDANGEQSVEQPYWSRTA